MPNICDECVEVIGIPKQIDLKDLEHTVCKILSKTGFDIGEDRIEKCDRLVKSERFVEEKIVSILRVLKNY